MPRKKLGEILMMAGVIDEPKLRVALAEQRRWGGPLGRILVDMKLITEDVMVKALSHQLNFPLVNLDAAEVDLEVLDLVSGEIAEQHSVIPIKRQGNFLDVAMADPTNLGIIDELRIRTHLNIRPNLAGPKAIERALARFYNRGIGTLQGFGNEAGGIASAGGGEAAASSQMSGMRMLEATTDAGLRDVGDGPPGLSAPPALAGVSSAAPSAAAARRAQQYGFAEETAREQERVREIQALQARVQHLEALVARDEDVLRKLLSLLVQKGVVSREEILERIK